ncbi:MAG: TA system VapC family ribonuclease toxin [Bryobacteraceae bacterium]
MNTWNFLDANVWLALIWDRHEHAERARAWFECASAERFLFCRFTQLTVLRLLTTAGLMSADVCTMAGAWQIWGKIAADERIAFLAEPEGIEPRFRGHSQLASASPKVWADAYLLAFAQTAGLKLITFDRALGTHAAEAVVLG